MPNFDFLDPGHPDAPAGMEVRPHRYRTWGWSIEAPFIQDDLIEHQVVGNLIEHKVVGNEIRLEYILACLGDDALYIRAGYENLSDRARDISQLNSNEPSAVLKSKCQRYPLSAIHRLRYVDSSGHLELIDIDGSMQPIVDVRSTQTRLIFESLRQRLAPNAAVETEVIRNRKSLQIAVAVLITTLIVAGVLIYRALFINRPYDVIEAAVPVMVIGLGAVAISAVAISVIARYLNPLQIQSVTVRR